MTTKTKELKGVEITVQVGELTRALSRVREVMPGRSRTLPIVEYAHVRTVGDKLRFVGTNLEQYVTVEAGGAGFVAGNSCVSTFPVRSVMTFLTALMREGKKVENKLVHLKLVEKSLALEVPDVGSLEWDSLPDVENFPLPPESNKDTEQGVCDGATFLLGLRCVVPAMASEDSRPVLTCVGMNNQCIVAADGFRLHVFERDDLGLGLPPDEAHDMVLLPAEAVRLLLRLFKGQEKIDCKFHRKAEHRAWFEVDGMQLATLLVQGTYPNYRQLMPGGGTTKVSFSAPVMGQRLEMIGGGIEIVRLMVDPAVENGEVLKVSAREDGRRLNLTVPVKSEAPERAGVAFNRKFLMDAVRLFSMIDMTYSTPSSPGKFKGDIEGLTVVVMPMFVQW